VVGVDVIVYNVAGGEAAGNVQDKEAAPLPYGLSVPTSEAVNPVGVFGSKKLSCAEDFIPLFLEIAISYLLIY